MRNRTVVVFVSILLMAGLVSVVSPAHAAQSPVLRHTSLGLINGLNESQSTGTYSWLGVPYAEPPVGDRRWREPVTHRPWQGVRDTQKYGDGCIQEGRFFSPAPSGPHYGLDVRDGLKEPVGAEDCLTLNVFRPSTAQQDLPVIVFIHGGSNMVGYSADPMYDGRALAQRANAVVVTVNYRVGVFGWLDLPALKTGDAETDSGNFGTLDQVEALRFVNRNARVFGGDPSNVAVMGESAGAVNVWALMVTPLSKGLIDKAIPLSGGFNFATPDQSRTYAYAFAEDALGSTDDGKDTARRLRSMPAADLIRAQVRRGEVVGDPPRVLTDGAVLPADHNAAIAAGKFRDVPVLAGNTLEEGKLFGAGIDAYRPTDYDRFTWQYHFDPNQPSRFTVRDFITDEYLPTNKPGGWNDASDELTDEIFMGIIDDSMTSLQEAGHEALYYYRFGWSQEPAPFDKVYGAAHAIDLPFVFNNFDDGFFTFAFNRKNEPGRRELSDLMTGNIRAFAWSGDPQHRGLSAEWEQWPRTVDFDAGNRHATSRSGSFER